MNKTLFVIHCLLWV